MRESKFSHYVFVFLRLVKFPLSLMVAFSALTGYFLTGNSNLTRTFMLLAGVLLLSGSSAGLNQVQEHNFDLLMERTKNRPIPSGQVSVFAAMTISLMLMLLGGLFLGSLGLFPFLLGLLNIALYNLIYTPLKRITWLAIIPGSLVGAIPPLIGWTSGGLYVFNPVILFLFFFVLLWQVPHFWLIFIRYGKDYTKAGFSVLPAYLNRKRIKNMVFCWVLITSGYLCSYPLFGLKFISPLIGLFIPLNLLFIIFFYKFLFGNEANHSIHKAFILINSFAVTVFLILILGSR
jgi:heme o synthase